MEEGKVESSSRIKDGNVRLELGDDEMQRTWKGYFEDLYNMNTQKQVNIFMIGFGGLQRGSYFEEQK